MSINKCGMWNVQCEYRTISLKLVVMSSNFSSRSEILNKLSNSQTEGANSNISSAYRIINTLLFLLHNLAKSSN